MKSRSCVHCQRVIDLMMFKRVQGDHGVIRIGAGWLVGPASEEHPTLCGRCLLPVMRTKPDWYLISREAFLVLAHLQGVKPRVLKKHIAILRRKTAIKDKRRRGDVHRFDWSVKLALYPWMKYVIGAGIMSTGYAFLLSPKRAA